MSILFIYCLTALPTVNIVKCRYDTSRFIVAFAVAAFSLFCVAGTALQRIKYNIVRAFKHRYIASLDYRYKISGSFRPAYLRASGPFVDGISYFGCEDKIAGVYDGVFFSFADVCVSYTDERHSSREIFFYAEFKKRVNSVAVILPLLSARSTLSGLKKIAMDDSEFSSAFSVYSADAASASL